MKNILIAFFALAVVLPLFPKATHRAVNKTAQVLVKKPEQSALQRVPLIQKFSDLEKKDKFISDITATKVDSIEMFGSADTSLYRFSYDNNGNLIGYMHYYRIGKILINIDRATFTYNQAGKNTIEAYEKWSNEVWEKNYRVLYSRNSAGSVDTSIYQESEANSWVNISKSIYQYDLKERRLSNLYQNWVNGLWVNDSWYRFTYDINGNTTEQLGSNWVNGAWAFSSKYTHVYNEFGDEISSYSENVFSDGTISIMRSTNTFNAQRQLIKRFHEQKVDSLWVNAALNLFEYGTNPRTEKLINVFWEDTAWVSYNYYLETFDVKNNRVGFQTGYWVNDNWVDDYRLSYTYNSVNKLLTEFYEECTKGVWSPYYKDTYTYDPTGEFTATYHCDAWENGVMFAADGYINFNVDDYMVTGLYVEGVDVKFWYKKMVIPVELTAFSGKVKDASVLLSWQTATETNNKGFEVERKSGNSEWIKIGFVAGKGTTVKISDYLFSDINLPEGTISYRLKQIDFDGSIKYSAVVEVSKLGITSFSLEQNYPNPFNPATTISYTVLKESRVSIKIFSLTGQLVKEIVNGLKGQGIYFVNFDASAFSSGVYFYTIEANPSDGSSKFNKTNKMVLIK